MLNKFLKYYSIVSLWGFQILMLFVYGNSLGGLSQRFTLPYRAIISFFALLIGLRYSKLITKDKEFIPILLFFILIIIRCIYDTSRNDIVMGFTGSTYLLRWISIVVIPSIPFFISHSDNGYKNILKGFNITVYLFAVFFFVFYSEYLTYDYRSLHYSMGVSYSRLINPLIFGYIGLFGATLFLSELFINKSIPRKNILMFLFSLFMLIFSGSRGPIISFFIVFLITLFLISRNLFRSIILILFFLFLLLLILPYLDLSNYSIIDRFSVLTDNYQSGNINELGSNRGVIWKRAISQFVENPIFGSGIEEKISKYVAHNAFIEAFTSTGILGGILFIIIVLRSLKNALYLIKIKSKASFISFLYISILITSLLSSSIFSPQIWFLIILLITSKRNEINRRHRI